MLPVGILFIFIAGISFLGFVINALFDKIKITSVLPLILLGLLIGPVLNLVSVGPGSLIAQLTPYVAAIAIAFVIFDVGINIRMKPLGAVLSGATMFTLITQVTVGLVLAIVVHYAFGWSAVISLIFGFAVSGPSAIITPALVRKITASDSIKTTLVYESVLTDVLQLVVPLTLISLLLNPAVTTLSSAGAEAFTIIFGALLIGAVSAFFWLYVLNRFGEYAKGYSWMLTITMIIATYGISQQLGLSSTIAVFVFGIIFANVGFHSDKEEKRDDWMGSIISRYFAIKQDVTHTIAYQKEIVFFVSTFFFVYIGMLFGFGTVTPYELLLGVAFVAVIMLIRAVTTPILRGLFSPESKVQKLERSLIYFNKPRGLSSLIIATLLVSYSLAVTGFVNMVFLLVLFTNIAFSIGVMYTYKPMPAEQGKGTAEKKKQDRQPAKAQQRNP